jgi:hypothetical protein
VHSLAVLADTLADAPNEAGRVRAEALKIAVDLSGPDALPLLDRLLDGPAEVSRRRCA